MYVAHVKATIRDTVQPIFGQQHSCFCVSSVLQLIGFEMKQWS